MGVDDSGADSKNSLTCSFRSQERVTPLLVPKLAIVYSPVSLVSGWFPVTRSLLIIRSSILRRIFRPGVRGRMATIGGEVLRDEMRELRDGYHVIYRPADTRSTFAMG